MTTGTRSLRTIHALWLVVVLATLVEGCGRGRRGGGGDDDDDDDTVDGDADPDGDAGSDADTDSDADADSDGGPDGPADPSLPYCVLRCIDATDCCGEDQGEDCPNEGAYRKDCIDGYCLFVGCRGSSDCDAGENCFDLPVTGFNSALVQSTVVGVCALPCEIDDDCDDPEHECLEAMDGQGFCADDGWDDPCEGKGCMALGFACDTASGDCYCMNNEACDSMDYGSLCFTP